MLDTPDRSPASILVVDDDAVICEALRMVLEQEGYTVRTAADGQQALEALRHAPTPPHLILLDLMMPVMSGWEFRERQRQDPALASIPVVVLSANRQAVQWDEVLGDVGYVPKPFDMSELIAAVRRYALPHRPKLLVVDDEPFVRRFLTFTLRNYGFQVAMAGGGEEALRLYREEQGRIDLVLLDVQMPDLDGPQTLRALRALDPRVRCCFMTGHAGDHTASEFEGLGALHVFEKPFSDLPQVMRTLWKTAQASAAGA